ncbi:LuxR C-terminal-related transcriptional regulator [Streptomyces lydicus]|nr:LuxR C-terminal-related transcriptional regulator [Streptomyces lydicus]
MHPELADALTGRADAERILDRLVRDNCFVQPVAGTRWFRVHPLFAGVLHARLRSRWPGLEPVLHRRAARWFAASGQLTETLVHAAAAGDWPYAAGEAVRHLLAGRLLAGLDEGRIDALFSGMPADVPGAEAALVTAARLLARHDAAAARRWVLRAERRVRHREAAAGAGPEVRLTLALLRLLLAPHGTGSRAGAAARRTAELMAEVPAYRLKEHPEIEALRCHGRACALLAAGRPDETRAAFEETVRACTGEATHLVRHAAWGGSRWPRPSAVSSPRPRTTPPARSTWPSGRAYPRTGGRGRSAGPGHRGVRTLRLPDGAAPPGPGRRVHRHRRRPGAAGRTGRRTVPGGAGARPVGGGVGGPGRGRAAGAGVARRAAGRGAFGCRAGPRRPAAALSALHRPGPRAPGGPPCPGTPRGPWRWRSPTSPRAAPPAPSGSSRRPTPARRRICPTAYASACCGPAPRHWPGTGRPPVPCWVRHWTRPPRAAAPAVRRGRALAAAPAPGRPAARGTVVDGRAPGRPAGPVLVEALSGREREVLAYAARMMSNEEIAAALHLSVNTVKTHLRSVYRKLGTSRRREAVERGRELHLL